VGSGVPLARHLVRHHIFMASPKKLFIAIPVYRQVPFEFCHSLLRLAVQGAGAIQFGFKVGDSLVSRSRNQLTADFLASDCDKMLFIDSDLVFTPDDVMRIAHHDVPLVGGVYPLKQEGEVQWCVNGFPGRQSRANEYGLQEVRYVGTGFMCIARSVFEELAENEFAPEYQDDKTKRSERDFWRVGGMETQDATRRYLSEDWHFCQNWLDIGGKVFVDTRVQLGHVGTITFPLQTQIAQLQATLCPMLPASK